MDKTPRCAFLLCITPAHTLSHTHSTHSHFLLATLTPRHLRSPLHAVEFALADAAEHSRTGATPRCVEREKKNVVHGFFVGVTCLVCLDRCDAGVDLEYLVSGEHDGEILGRGHRVSPSLQLLPSCLDLNWISWMPGDSPSSYTDRCRRCGCLASESCRRT